jgi:hypothetical protein
MGTAAVGTATEDAQGRREQLRAALARALGEVDADERIGPLINATHLRMRIELTDLGMAVNLAASEEGHNLTWSFADDPGWEPKLVLQMSSEVANRYLQGRQSIAVGLARGEIRCRGDSKSALLYLPAAHLLSRTYRRVIETEYPALAA